MAGSAPQRAKQKISIAAPPKKQDNHRPKSDLRDDRNSRAPYFGRNTSRFTVDKNQFKRIILLKGERRNSRKISFPDVPGNNFWFSGIFGNFLCTVDGQIPQFHNFFKVFLWA